MKKPSVSAIVPFLNEEKMLASVVKELLNHPHIDEVICVNDGSTDNSLKHLQPFKKKIVLIDLKKNHGKGYALAQGITHAKGEIVAFFDADLTNLNSEHIDSLLIPLLKKKTRAILGYSTGGYFAFWFKSVTGERAYYRKDLLPHLQALSRTNRFSTEYYLNNIFPDHQIQRVPLHKLVHLLKHEKYSLRLATKETVKDIKAITTHAWERLYTSRS